MSLHRLAEDGTQRCGGHWAGTQGSASSSSFPLQIISQKDEHCWVGELNGLRGEALVSSWGRGLGSEVASPLLPLPPGTELGESVGHQAPHRTLFSHRLVPSQVRGSSR